MTLQQAAMESTTQRSSAEFCRVFFPITTIKLRINFGLKLKIDCGSNV
jgi:hypothetical protein